MSELKTLMEQYKMIPLLDSNFNSYINEIILRKEIGCVYNIQGNYIEDSKIRNDLKSKEDNFTKILYGIVANASFKADMLYDVISNISNTKLSKEYINAIVETCNTGKVGDFEKCIMMYYLLYHSAKVEAEIAFLAMNLMLKSKGYLPIILEENFEEHNSILLCNKGFSPLVKFMKMSAIKLYETCIYIKVKHSLNNVSYNEIIYDFNNIIKTDSHKSRYQLTNDLVGTENFLYKNAGDITDKQQIIISFICEKLGIKFNGSNSKEAYYFIKEYYYKARNGKSQCEKDKMEVF